MKLEEFNPHLSSVFNNQPQEGLSEEEYAVNFEQRPDCPGKKLETMTDRSGRKFYKIESHRNAPSQMFLSLILKGTMPVSDIVYIKTKNRPSGAFYSYDIPLENIDAEYEYDAYKDVAADAFVLEYIFGESDHRTPDNRKRGAQKYQISMYDFEIFGKYFWKAENISQESIDMFVLLLNKKSLLKRLNDIRIILEGESGLIFLKNIVNYIKNVSGKTPYVLSPNNPKVKKLLQENETTDVITLFRDTVLERIVKTETLLNN